MAKALRIDGVPIRHADGRIQLNYTYGSPPLPVAPSGEGLLFPSIDKLLAFLDESESSLTPQTLMYMAVAQWRAKNAALSNSVLIANKTITWDAASPQVLQIN